MLREQKKLRLPLESRCSAAARPQPKTTDPGPGCSRSPVTRGFLVGVGRFELPASTSRTWRANQAALHPVAAIDAIRRSTGSASGGCSAIVGLTVGPEIDHRIDDRGVGGETLGVAAAGQDRVGGPPETQRVERLDQPALGAAAAGQVHVGLAVEQHQHRDVGQHAGALVEPQRHRHGHAAHRADLQVEHGEVGRVAADPPATTRPSRQTVKLVSSGRRAPR